MSDKGEFGVKAEPSGSRPAKQGARPAAASPKSRKRARRDPPVDDPEATPEQHSDGEQPGQASSDDGDDAGDDGSTPLIRDERDGYVSGSIVRIKLHNFLTYDAVEFTPGPALNMVLGPNGTGKSTIACAIAVGLGFSTKVLGRSQKISEYVKTGADDGWVEIELKGLPKKANVVIRRFLNKDSDATRFHLNGQTASAKDVSARMEELHVEVGNLCTFLPQDRVSSFAQLSAPQLLKETQKAAGDTRLSGWHGQLIEERQTQATLQTSLAEDQEQLKRREDKHVEQERDVRLFERRQELEFELAVVSLLIPIAEYNAAREAYNTIKGQKADCEEELEALNEANKPFKESQAELKRKVDQFDVTKKALLSKASKTNKDVGAKESAIAKVESEVVRTREDLNQLKKTEKESRKQIASLEKDIGRLEEIVADKPDPPDYTEITARTAEIATERAALQNECTELHGQQEQLTRELASLNRDESRIKAEGIALQDKQKLKASQCQKYDPDTYAAVQWMREQKKLGNFKGGVHEPARLSISPKEKRDIALAEAPISQAMFRTFVFEQQVDYDFMMRALNDNVTAVGRKLRINGAQLKQGRFSRRDYPDAFSQEQLKKWGFDCLAIDLIDGDDAVLAYLCENARLNSVPVSLTRGAQLDHRDIEASGRVSRYYTPDGSHSIKRSRYGAKGNLVESRPLNDAKIMSMGVDNERLDELKRNLRDLTTKKDTISKQHSDLVQAHDVKREVILGLEKERANLQEERKKLQIPLAKWQKNNVKLQSQRAQLQTELNKPSADKRRDSLRKDMASGAEKRCRLSLEHKDLLMKVSKATIDGARLSLQGLQAESDLRAMANSADEKDQEIAEKQAEYNALSAETSRLKKAAKDAQDDSLEAVSAAEPEHQEVAKKRREEKDPDLAELAKKKLETESQLNVMQPIDAGVVAKYEKRAAEIADFRTKVATGQERLDQSTAVLKKVEGKWLPKLERLVQQVSSKFSTAFKTLGLVGEIRIAKDVDYDKWGIEVLVAFRDKEALQVLTAHRQSGGERALTTVMYLMSLASLAKAPFALVDEINQGMDQRVERNVHNTLVATTCKKDVGQYFLITPKLLPNLDYHSRMKVLVIQNGEWLPETLSLRDVVAKKLKRNGQTPATPNSN